MKQIKKLVLLKDILRCSWLNFLNLHARAFHRLCPLKFYHCTGVGRRRRFSTK